MWQETDKGLYRKFTFADFKAAFAFMTKVAGIAEARQHHPTWTNTYNTVEMWLISHDAGDQITDKDRDMVIAIDQITPNP